MTATIDHIADLKNDNTLIAPSAMLRREADSIDAGKLRVTRAVVLMLDDDD